MYLLGVKHCHNLLISTLFYTKFIEIMFDDCRDVERIKYTYYMFNALHLLQQGATIYFAYSDNLFRSM